MASLPPIDTSKPSQTETASFALGCFWESDALFGSVPGVVRTQVGYMGGTKDKPTYHNLGDHSETVQVEYDPERVSYDELLSVFWAGHQAAEKPWSRQYRSAIFYHNEVQHRLALNSKARREAELGSRLYTDIEPAGQFYVAEGYHQKYYLRGNSRLLEEFKAMYPSDVALVKSTAAARVNGYAAHAGVCGNLQAEVESYGLSEGAERQLVNAVCG